MKFTVLVIIAVFSGLWHIMGRSQRYAEALRPECLLCEGHEVDERDDGYACRDCGFDTDWQNDPEKAETLDMYRALTHAREDLRLAAEMLKGDHAHQQDAIELATNYELSAQSYLQRANDLDPTLLEDLDGMSLKLQYERVSELRDTLRALLGA